MKHLDPVVTFVQLECIPRQARPEHRACEVILKRLKGLSEQPALSSRAAYTRATKPNDGGSTKSLTKLVRDEP